MKTLILDAHASSALAATQALGRAGVELHVAGISGSLALRSRYPQRKIVYPQGFAFDQMLSWVRSLDEAENYGLIIPATETSLRLFQHCADDDPLRKKCGLANRDSVETALDKMKTWELAHGLGIAVPRSTLITGGKRGTEPESYPVVLKPLKSQVRCAGEFVYVSPSIATDATTRDRYLQQWLPYTPVQQQQYCFGHGVGIECLYTNGVLCWWFAHERLHELPLTGGASSYRRSIVPPVEMLESARDVLDALQWHGVAMVEFRVDGNGRFVLIEINPRLWGSLPLAIKCGVNFPVGIYRLANGEKLTQPEYKTHYYMRNIVWDLDWMRENWRANHDDEMLLTHPRGRSFLEWLRPVLGHEGWDHFDWRDLRPITVQVSHHLRRIARGLWVRLCERFEYLMMFLTHHRNLWRMGRNGLPRKRLVFVCYGNICRSPFAEALARRQLQGWNVSSSGLHESVERRSPSHIQELAKEFEVDLNAHRSCCLSHKLIASADAILLMDPDNFRAVVRKYPGAANKTLFLGLLAPKGKMRIPDPYTLEKDEARKSCELIAAGIEGLNLWLEGGSRK